MTLWQISLWPCNGGGWCGDNKGMIIIIITIIPVMITGCLHPPQITPSPAPCNLSQTVITRHHLSRRGLHTICNLTILKIKFRDMKWWNEKFLVSKLSRMEKVTLWHILHIVTNYASRKWALRESFCEKILWKNNDLRFDEWWLGKNDHIFFHFHF